MTEKYNPIVKLEIKGTDKKGAKFETSVGNWFTTKGNYD